jgi:hypothetical protein
MKLAYGRRLRELYFSNENASSSGGEPAPPTANTTYCFAVPLS